MKIVIVAHSSNRYGAELALVEMVDVLRRHHECIVFLPNYGPLAKDLEEMGIAFEISTNTSWIHRKNGPLLPLRILKTLILHILFSIHTTLKIRKHKPDIIFSNTIVIDAGMISSFLLHCPHIWFIHEFLGENPDVDFDIGEKKTMQLVNRYSNSVVIVSKTLMEKYRRFIDPDKLKLSYLRNIRTPSPSEKTAWPIPATEDYLKLILIGSLGKNKNQLLAIEAMHALKNSGVERIQLLIVGSGDKKYLQDLHKKVREYSLEDTVYFLGYVNNPYPIIMGSDCLLMLSNFESFSRVVIEAMSCGKIVIAARNSGGPSEIIKDQETGLFYEKGSVLDLASKIKYIYDHREVIKEIGGKAKDFAISLHNPSAYSHELDGLIQDALGLGKDM